MYDVTETGCRPSRAVNRLGCQQVFTCKVIDQLGQQHLGRTNGSTPVLQQNIKQIMLYVSLVVRKPVFGVSDQVPQKPLF